MGQPTEHISADLVCHRCGQSAVAAEATHCSADGSWLVSAEDTAARPDDRYLGRTVGGRFGVVGLLGEGITGTVYLAVQQSTGHAVALKMIDSGGLSGPEKTRGFDWPRVTTFETEWRSSWTET